MKFVQKSQELASSTVAKRLLTTRFTFHKEGEL